MLLASAHAGAGPPPLETAWPSLQTLWMPPTLLQLLLQPKPQRLKLALLLPPPLLLQPLDLLLQLLLLLRLWNLKLLLPWYGMVPQHRVRYQVQYGTT